MTSETPQPAAAQSLKEELKRVLPLQKRMAENVIGLAGSKPADDAYFRGKADGIQQVMDSIAFIEERSEVQPPAAAQSQTYAERGMMNREAFEKLIAENLAWLDTLPNSPERSHVHEIVRNCVKHYYGQPPAAATQETDYKALYFELLFAVGNKFEGETRHQTALCYIRRAEEPNGIASAATQKRV